MVHAVALGALILLGSLYPAIRIVRSLPRGANHRQWILLTVMIALFFTGYLWYWLGHIGVGRLQSIMDHGETVALVFFLGAIFVLAGAERLGNRVLELVRNDELAPGVRCSISIGAAELAPDREHDPTP